MNLKNVMYTTGAAMALFGTTAVTTITANAAVSPTQQTQQAKSNDNSKAQQAKSNDSSKTQQNNTKANDADKSKTTSTANKADTTPAKTQTATNTNANQDNGSKQSSNNADANKTNTNSGSNSTSNSSANNNAGAKTDDKQSNSTTFDQKAPRLTGSAYKSENAGFKTSVKNRHANKDVTVNYSINTYESDGSASSKPFQIKIYKDGSLYKTIDASSGTATGSFSAPKGTYTLQVLTSQSTHYTGGLSVQ